MAPAAAALAAAVGVAGCGSSGGAAPVGDGPVVISTPPPGGSSEPPLAAPDQVLLQVAVAPGFVPFEYAVSNRPPLTIYGDGRVVVARFPGGVPTFMGQPLPLEVGQLDDDVLAHVVEEWTTSGAFSDDAPDFGSPTVTDLPTTLLRFRDAAGHLVERDIYALGSGSLGVTGLTPQQREQRHEVASLISRTRAVVGVTTAYAPHSVEVIQLDDPRPPDRAPAGTRRWPGPALGPLLRPQPSWGPCATLNGKAASTVLGAARHNDSLEWRDGDVVRRLVVLALLPGERSCR